MRRRGFTLIELLAVIVILGILLLIVVPKINNVIDNAQKGAYKSTNSVIISELKRQNGLEITPQVYTFTNGVMSPDVGITGELPKNGTVEVNSLGEVQIVTSNDKYCAIKRFNEDDIAIFTAGDRLCNVVVEITLTVNPNGGTYNSSTSNTTYQVEPEATQNISNPTRSGYSFDGWTLTGGGAISNGTFTADLLDATLTARWTLYPTLIVNPNGGTYFGSTSNTNYQMFVGTTQDISNPLRDGYVFTGWSSTCSGCLSGSTYTMNSSDGTLTANWLAYASMYTYTGSSTVINDGSGNWRIKFLTSGTFTPLVNMTIDVFLVGGGGGGGSDGSGGGGGGGGYAATWANINLQSGTTYSITIGTGGSRNLTGGATTAFSHSVNGGIGTTSNNGGAGGSGGAGWGGSGGINGSDGTIGLASSGYNGAAGTGQGNTTREFAETSGTLYSRGGNGYNEASQAANTGYGGSGAATSGNGGGGSGIVVIRNIKISTVGASTKYSFSYSGSYLIENGNTDNWKIKILSTGILLPFSTTTVDAFLVGGGGGGGTDGLGGGGGGSGYTGTWTDITIQSGTTYSIVVGLGGAKNLNGGTTTAFSHSVNGGGGTTTNTGGSGGSGGAGWGGSGGTNGSAGTIGPSSSGYNGSAGAGQGSTTKEFAESSGTLYSRGGNGYTESSPAANTGNGGSGAATIGNGNGGSGIVIIRKH